MLVRVSCDRCRISCLWTDEPEAFLRSVCHQRSRCQARLMNEEFGVDAEAAEPVTDAHPPAIAALGG
jgi:hypothetical protein